MKEWETALLSLRDQASPDQRIETKGLKTQMHNRPTCLFKLFLRSKCFTGMGILTGSGLSWKHSLLQGESLLWQLWLQQFRKVLNLTWRQCSIFWEKVLGHSPPTKWSKMSTASQFLSCWSKTCQSLSGKALLSAIIFPSNHSNKHNPNYCVSLFNVLWNPQALFLPWNFQAFQKFYSIWKC